MKILFLHGWHSVVGGVKPTFLKDNGHMIINPALDDDDFPRAVATAQAEFDQHQPDVVVGSSRGGAIALNINSGNKPLVLLCPAWKNWGSVTTLKPNAIVLHSRNDDIIPFGDSEDLVTNSSLAPTTLIEIGNDHRLADSEPLEMMLQCCERFYFETNSVVDHPAISGSYLFPQPRSLDNPYMVAVNGAELACYRHHINSNAPTLVHFHGNGEAVVDYVPEIADRFAELGLNSLFVEYRQYGSSTGTAQLRAMLSDGEAVLRNAGLNPSRVIAMGRSIGSLYAIELVERLPELGGLILESAIADVGTRLLEYADISKTGHSEHDVLAEVQYFFNHRKKLQNYHNPMLVMHTENDGLVDISHAERLYKWGISSSKRLLRFPYGNHNTIIGVNWTEYFHAVREFSKLID